MNFAKKSFIHAKVSRLFFHMLIFGEVFPIGDKILQLVFFQLQALIKCSI